MELASDVLPAPVRLRLYADFEVSVNLKATAGFPYEQSALLAAILASPKAMREVRAWQSKPTWLPLRNRA